MSLKKLIILLMFGFIFVCVSSNSYTAEQTSKKNDTTITRKIEIKKLSGINLVVAELYNENRLLYAVVVTLVMALLGSIMAFGTDIILKYFGMNVSKISHKE